MRLALVAVAALALAAAACGGVENDPNLAQAAERTEATGSFAVEMKARFAGGDGFEMSCDGAVDSSRQRARLACHAPEGGSETISIDGTTYKRDASTDGKWLKSEYEAPVELTPERILGLLRSASRKTERVGDEDVREEPTVRYALTVDCEQAELPVVCDRKTALVDVWIDGDGLVRRIAFDEGVTAVSIEFFDFGTPAVIQAPRPDQVETPDPLETLPVDPPGPCKPDEAAPIRVNQAIEALRRQGFELGRDEQGCTAGMAGELTSRGQVDLRDGHLTCFVLTAPGATTAVSGVIPARGSSETIPEPFARTFENVECTLFVDESRAKDRVERLEAALAELKREMGG